jgi:hypothetical protein
MFILHVKHYYFQLIVFSLLAKKYGRVSIFIGRKAPLLPANYKIFEVLVLVFARAFAEDAILPGVQNIGASARPSHGCHIFY